MGDIRSIAARASTYGTGRPSGQLLDISLRGCGKADTRTQEQQCSNDRGSDKVIFNHCDFRLQRYIFFLRSLHSSRWAIASWCALEYGNAIRNLPSDLLCLNGKTLA